MNTIEKPTIEERYVRVTSSRDLSIDPNRRTDADYLLAAGYAAAGNAAASMALRFYNLRMGDKLAIRDLSDIAGAWLLGRSMRKGRKKLRGVEARDLATRTLFYWAEPVCKPCNGLGHPLMPNSPVINYGHDCPVCHGTSDEARWLIDELDRLCGLIFHDMARALSNKLDL
jgi:hypothetical protein